MFTRHAPRRLVAPALAATLAAAAACLSASPGAAAGLTAGTIVKPGEPANPAMLPLVNHRAVYRVTLLKSTGSKSPTGAQGRVSYEFTGSRCEGYSQNFPPDHRAPAGRRRDAPVRHALGHLRGSRTRRNFSFNVTTSVDNGSNETIDGRASKKHDALAIHISKPARETRDVDQAVLFPTEHLQQILAAARAGERLLGVKVFDGSDDGKKVFDTTAIHRPADRRARRRQRRRPRPARRHLRRWPVSISYFEEGKKDGVPSYTLAFDLYENGISRALRFDYGDFVLAGQMTALELLPARSCAAK